MRKSTETLSFPNPSRSYDSARHCVCFWGYDNSREISFLVDDESLTKLNPDMGAGETALLATFDRNRERILGLAKSAYTGGPQNRYAIHV
ncbi:hypothetical protein BGLT_01713 [Caballeronia glathei]|jgi:hypothetical protein|uniref:DUF1488 domain-containing protein n=1 Tax=Caballeronia glathei TaxID=60547 RepID=A0A069PSA6_9BURK|nr:MULTISPECIES: DUF1488 domain-containing protein [Burkholderiaceae]KDR42759.1 hypothetical protein BG61_06345 [Caballeronia glathei]TCK37017.1 uncharacterized protein DUF1488 [Paraburkholderia sp. BL8N3]CDY79020.1 hypothetical protein BGLT_01713 [Caballeronia glathei]